MKEPLESQVNLNDILVFKEFYKAGSTALLTNVFNDPMKHNNDTAKITVEKQDVKNFETLLNSAKVKKHVQMKINVELALVVKIDKKDHYFIISTPELIIDLVSNQNYVLKEDSHKKLLSEFIEKYK
ncbi:hypothetical protein INQ51_10080 [Maribellus sp. CM-23]|uniref:hypothetical protein n=1 Tax=Maribellus sp. CM-23 TaxID=2781026 RepID=UPI001F3F6681|nr:hypothetical protein [Maribellus sp. CM-23]MCE4564657.1 hypothetical protein [Maribellus sp. CM-23]